MRTEVIVAAALVALARAAGAQSTDDLVPRKPWSVEAAIGRELEESAYAPRPWGVYAAVRRTAGDFGGWRLMAWHLGRSMSTYFSNGEERRVKHNVTALAFGVDMELKVARKLFLEPFLGAGLAAASANGSTYGTQSPYKPNDTGRVIVGGAALRYRALTIQQHLVILHGAQMTITEFREYYPVMIGVRF